MKQTKEQPQTINDPNLSPGTAELHTEFGGRPFVIAGDAEAVLEQAERLQSLVGRMAITPAVKPVEAPRIAPKPQDGYIDTSTLHPRELVRRKLAARMYDLVHRTDMHGLLQEKINEDRDVAFARKLGLITTTHCQKHAKAVAELRGQ